MSNFLQKNDQDSKILTPLNIDINPQSHENYTEIPKLIELLNSKYNITIGDTKKTTKDTIDAGTYTKQPVTYSGNTAVTTNELK